MEQGILIRNLAEIKNMEQAFPDYAYILEGLIYHLLLSTVRPTIRE